MNDTIEKIREFNRFYTLIMNLLNNSYLDSSYSMSEARVLYELYNNKGCYANTLVQKLHIDKSYLSRMLKKFENGKLLIKTVSEKDSRSYHLELTQLGIYETKKLIELSNEYILNIIRNLDSNEIKQIEESIEIMTTLLKKGVDE